MVAYVLTLVLVRRLGGVFTGEMDMAGSNQTGTPRLTCSFHRSCHLASLLLHQLALWVCHGHLRTFLPVWTGRPKLPVFAHAQGESKKIRHNRPILLHTCRRMSVASSPMGWYDIQLEERQGYRTLCPLWTIFSRILWGASLAEGSSHSSIQCRETTNSLGLLVLRILPLRLLCRHHLLYSYLVPSHQRSFSTSKRHLQPPKHLGDCGPITGCWCPRCCFRLLHLGLHSVKYTNNCGKLPHLASYLHNAKIHDNAGRRVTLYIHRYNQVRSLDRISIHIWSWNRLRKSSIFRLRVASTLRLLTH